MRNSEISFFFREDCAAVRECVCLCVCLRDASHPRIISARQHPPRGLLLLARLALPASAAADGPRLSHPSIFLVTRRRQINHCNSGGDLLSASICNDLVCVDLVIKVSYMPLVRVAFTTLYVPKRIIYYVNIASLFLSMTTHPSSHWYDQYAYLSNL